MHIYDIYIFTFNPTGLKEQEGDPRVSKERAKIFGLVCRNKTNN